MVRTDKAYVKKTKWGWQVYVPGPHGYIPQGQPHSTKKEAEEDARAFKATTKTRTDLKKRPTKKQVRSRPRLSYSAKKEKPKSLVEHTKRQGPKRPTKRRVAKRSTKRQVAGRHRLVRVALSGKSKNASTVEYTGKARLIGVKRTRPRAQKGTIKIGIDTRKPSQRRVKYIL